MSVTTSDQAMLTLPTARNLGGTSVAELADRVLCELTAAMELLGEQAPEEADHVRGTADHVRGTAATA
ncbi:hypothetical protein ACFV2N_46230 [Streptomyces sp. NPDC059680]|uniref:hypothetical protein n=1 Tax=Streptomyces sp. NPDC059680 TaxID=3346904 RepID=UPI00368009C9